MSTISKLYPLVRLNRSKRSERVAALRADLAKLDGLLKRGYAKLNEIELYEQRYGVPDPTKAGIKEQITNLFRARVVTQLTLDHIRKLVKDPARTGSAKDAILAKLEAT